MQGFNLAHPVDEIECFFEVATVKAINEHFGIQAALFLKPRGPLTRAADPKLQSRDLVSDGRFNQWLDGFGSFGCDRYVLNHLSPLVYAWQDSDVDGASVLRPLMGKRKVFLNAARRIANTLKIEHGIFDFQGTNLIIMKRGQRQIRESLILNQFRIRGAPHSTTINSFKRGRPYSAPPVFTTRFGKIVT